MEGKNNKVVFESGQYFEGTLQLRNPSQEVLDFVEKSIDEDSGIDVSKIIKLKNGFDFMVTSQRKLRAIGTKLSRQFPGELKSSRKLFTRNNQTSKEVYRVNVMFRLYDYVKGQIVMYKGEEMEVIGIGKKITLRGKKKIQIKYDDPYLKKIS